MATLNVGRELIAIRERTQRIILLSAVLHLVAGWVILQTGVLDRSEPLDQPEYLEITWIDPEPRAETLEVAASAPAPTPETESPAAPAEKVVRELPPPDPVSATTLADRLAALRSRTGESTKQLAAALETKLQPRAVTGALAAAPKPEARDLMRGGEVAAAATGPSAIAPREIQRAGVDLAALTRPAERAQRTGGEKREIQPGISLAGPVSGRALVQYDPPAYPDWARREGVEVTVELSFTVLPSGRVKENIRVERTSGYRDFDQRALASLRQWRFESLGGGATSEQWGRIEFNYRLKQAG